MNAQERNAEHSLAFRDRSRMAAYGKAERRMRRGKQLVISGFSIAFVGMLLYIAAAFAADASHDLGWPVIVSLGLVGFGTLLWLVGAFLYVTGGFDSDPSGPDLYF